MFNNVDEEPDFSMFQVPENVRPKSVASPLPSGAAIRVFNRMKHGAKKYSRRHADDGTLSLPCYDPINDNDFDQNSDYDGLENETVFTGFYYAPPVVEVPKKENKSWQRWIFEEFIAFIICLIYLIGFNIVIKAFLN